MNGSCCMPPGNRSGRGHCLGTGGGGRSLCKASYVQTLELLFCPVWLITMPYLIGCSKSSIMLAT